MNDRRKDEMNRGFSLSVTIVFLLLISTFAPMASTVDPTQPPVDTTTLYVGTTGWGPRFADPVRAYDTASRELIFNVYDTMISMGQPVTNDFGAWNVYEQYWEFQPCLATDVPTREEATKNVSAIGVPADPTGFVFSDGSTCIGWIDNDISGNLSGGDVLYTVEPDDSYRTWFVQPITIPEIFALWRSRYTFQIRTDPIINFVNETGHVVDTFDVYDVEYSLKRGLVQDQIGSPMWMFYKPLFDQMNSDFFDSNTTEPTAMSLAHLIDAAIEVSGNNLTINVGIPFPDIAFKQILCSTWASIVSKEFSISIGCWDGDLYTDSNGDGYPNWWDSGLVRRISRSPYDTEGAPNYVGTGPYRVTTLDESNNKVILTWNELYWQGWPCPYGYDGWGSFRLKSYLETVEIRYMADWDLRKSDFLACDLDVCYVPMTYMNELFDEYGQPVDPKIKTIKSLSPVLAVDAVFFIFTIDPSSPYIGSGEFPDGIPPNFFNNTHVRKAFAYGFNHTQYLQEAWFGEAICRETPLIYGLVPDYYTKATDPPYTYDENYEMAKQELQTATFNGTSIWDSGFRLTLAHNAGNDRMRIAWEMLSDFFAELSTYDGRTGSPFMIDVVEIPLYLILTYFYEYKLPMWCYSWLADYTDADNFVHPFLHSDGAFAYFQSYTTDNGWTTSGLRTGLDKDTLIGLAFKTLDTGPDRAEYYADLDDIYIKDCPGFPIAQPLGRRWQKYWVKAWYYNPLYPGNYYYHLYKEDVCWGSITGPSPGIPDGACAMRDIGYLANHFGAKAPDPAGTPPYDSRWAPGRYSCGGCDVTGDRIVNMRDIGFMCAHFGHGTGDP